MIFCKDFLFIHLPKTGGMSISRWLVNNYRGKMYQSIPGQAFTHARAAFAFDDIAARLTLVPGRRHENLLQAEQVVREHGFELADFDKIVTVARHPLDLERSYYYHLRKPAILKTRPAGNPEVAQAQAVEFVDFVKDGSFCGRYPAKVEPYFELEGRRPKNLQIIRMENLAQDVHAAFGEYIDERWPLEHRNLSENSKRKKGLADYPDDMIVALRKKQPYLSRMYSV